VILSGTGAPWASTALVTSPVSAFLASLGVNVHMGETLNGKGTAMPYSLNIPKVVAKCQEIGATWVRDVFDGVSTKWVAGHQALANAGIRASVICNNSAIGSTFVQTVAGTGVPNSHILAFEALNEPSVSGDNGAAVGTLLGQLNAGRNTYFPNALVSAPGLEADTYLSPVSPQWVCDIGNFHPYNREGRGVDTPSSGGGFHHQNPEATSTTNQVKAVGYRPIWVGEVGYPTIVDQGLQGNNGGVSYGCDSYTQGILLPRAWAQYWSLQPGGKWCAYELMNEATPAVFTDTEMAYGIYNVNFNPKAAAYAFNAIQTLMKDPGPPPPPRALPMTYTGTNTVSNIVALAHSDGSYWYLIWQAIEVWDPQYTGTGDATHLAATPVGGPGARLTGTAIADVPVTFTFAPAVSRVELWSGLTSSSGAIVSRSTGLSSQVVNFGADLRLLPDDHLLFHSPNRQERSPVSRVR